MQDRATIYSDSKTAYAVLPFLTIIVKKDIEVVIFKWGPKQRECDYEWFKNTIRFFYVELGCNQGKEK